MALPAQRVEMIPIDRITIVNPRLRSKKTFKGIVDNIAEIGLKRPITVTARQGEDGLVYDLVCGQGRLEAFRELDQTEVPALIVAVRKSGVEGTRVSVRADQGSRLPIKQKRQNHSKSH